uniref:Uncharacterized protein n=1 Tax=Aegilops tauschii subsp. strangulata TaxID=200361 RepID=A0A453PGJ6_AEGTS
MKPNNQAVRRAASTSGLLLILLLVAFTASNYSSLYTEQLLVAVPATPSSSSTAAAGSGSRASDSNAGAACDVAKGEWVPDPAAPYYTNATCPLIDARQDCMKYGKPGIDSILRWRWQPHGCDLPRFDAAAFLRLVRGKSMAFVGDSVARNHMQSLMCLLAEVHARFHSIDHHCVAIMSSRVDFLVAGRRAHGHAGGAAEGDRAQGLRALHAQVPLPGARLHGVRVLDAVPGAVEPDARRRAAVHGPAQRVPGRAGPGVEPRRRRLRLRRPQRRQVVHPPHRALRGRPPPRLRQRRRLPGQAQRHRRGAALRDARVVPDRAQGARRVPRPGGRPDGGAPALRERQVVRRRQLPEDGAPAEQREQPSGDRGRVPRRAGGGVPGRDGGGGGGEVRADGRERDDADEGRRAPRAVRALAAREGRLRHRLRALVLARPRRRLERAAAAFADMICTCAQLLGCSFSLTVIAQTEWFWMQGVIRYRSLCLEFRLENFP